MEVKGQETALNIENILHSISDSNRKDKMAKKMSVSLEELIMGLPAKDALSVNNLPTAEKNPVHRTVSEHSPTSKTQKSFVTSFSITPSIRKRWAQMKEKTHVMLEEDDFDDYFTFISDEITASFDTDELSDDIHLEDFGEFYRHRDCPRVFYSVDYVEHKLKDLMMSRGGDCTLLQDVRENPNVVMNRLGNATEQEKHVCLLQAALSNRGKLIEALLIEGSNIRFQDTNGLEAIHLAALGGALDSIKTLIAHDLTLLNAYDGNMQFVPLHCAVMGNSLPALEYLINRGTSPEKASALLHYAVRANALSCVQYLLKRIDVNQIGTSGETPLHIAADMGHIDILDCLLHYKANVEARTVGDELSPLHLAAESGHIACLRRLLTSSKNIGELKNSRGQTPLHLAARAQAIECMEALLDTQMDPNVKDQDGRTPFHSAVVRQFRTFDTLTVLLNRGANINEQDHYGYTALHLAALNELTQCVCFLLKNGADITILNKAGASALAAIRRKTPSALKTLKEKLDESITIYDPDSRDSEIEVKFDFHSVIPARSRGEIGYFKTLIDNGQKRLLKHPLCEAFLFLKWKKLQKYFYARLLFCLVFVIVLSLFITSSFRLTKCHNSDMNATDYRKNTKGHSGASIEWYVLVCISIIQIIKELYMMFLAPSWKKYMCELQHAMFWMLIFSVFLMSFEYTGKSYNWQVCIAALTVLMGWSYIMILTGQLPSFGLYVQMYGRVAKEFGKVFSVYIFLLIGFMFAFSIIFACIQTFDDPFTIIVKVIAMMVGEFDIQTLLVDGAYLSQGLHYTAHLVFLAFLLLISIVLMNLMIGLAVNDIQTLQSVAELERLVQVTDLVGYIESMLLSPYTQYLPLALRKFLEKNVLVSPAAYRYVLHVKPHNSADNRLPPQVINDAYKIAKSRKLSPPSKKNLNKRRSCETTNDSDTPTLITKQVVSKWLNVLQKQKVSAEKKVEHSCDSKINEEAIKRLEAQMQNLERLLIENGNLLQNLHKKQDSNDSEC